MEEILAQLDSGETTDEERMKEKAYRKGYMEGVYKTLEQFALLYHEKRYIRPKEIHVLLHEWASDVLNWKVEAHAPEVDLFQEKPKITRKSWPEIKQEITQEAGGRCQQCGCQGPFDLHHIKPVAYGGKPDKKNLLLLCKPCHRKKHRRKRTTTTKKPRKA